MADFLQDMGNRLGAAEMFGVILGALATILFVTALLIYCIRSCRRRCKYIYIYIYFNFPSIIIGKENLNRVGKLLPVMKVFLNGPEIRILPPQKMVFYKMQGLVAQICIIWEYVVVTSGFTGYFLDYDPWTTYITVLLNLTHFFGVWNLAHFLGFMDVMRMLIIRFATVEDMTF